MEHIKRVGRELMYKGSMLEFYKDTIVTPDGKTVYCIRELRLLLLFVMMAELLW